MKRVTIKDVAREANVSVTLVSFVMNAKRDENGRLDCPVNPETAERVLKVARELGYRRNEAAASLRSGRSNAIAVIPTDISNRFFSGVSRYIESKASEYGYTVFFGSSDEKASKLESILSALLSYNIDGVIVAPVKGSRPAIQRLVDAGIPVVLLDRDIEGMTDVSKVLLDDFVAGRMATRVLIENGYRKIEMISYSLGISSLLEREKGYADTMKAYGLEEFIRIAHTTYGSREEDVLGLIKDAQARGTEAFFLPTYSLSVQVLSAMKDMGLGTPDDFAVVGFDNSHVYRLFSNTVAHIRQPLQALGETCVELIHDMIDGSGAKQTIVLKPTLIPGGSVQKRKP